MPQPIDEKRDLLIKVAKLYYIEGRSQEEISQEVHVSRPTVSRLLKASISSGIVQIRIDDISSFGIELAKILRMLRSAGIAQSDGLRAAVLHLALVVEEGVRT